ncbi:uncharacterized protein LOC133500025 [Syngnathoides biaculeatus]|uniref:uncharacterized protein LOC133500025 n=1 Tax=Syngnathoides biaculeatus TaxID=300417 RepID=UPI002ADD7928|nr:uncharacterized protein LOC133500025 [Syngnathoides biaculeatus]
MAPLHVVHGYPPSLFPPLAIDSAVPSALTVVRRCKRTWEAAAHEQRLQVRSGPQEEKKTRAQGGTASVALHQRSPPGDGIPQTCSQVRWPVPKIINPVAVSLKLPRSMRVHPTFHVSRLRPNRTSSLVPPVKSLPHHGGRWAGVYCAPAAVFPPQRKGGFSTWWTGRDMARRSSPGSPPASSWTAPSSGTFTWLILMLLGRPEPAVEVGVGGGTDQDNLL